MSTGSRHMGYDEADYEHAVPQDIKILGFQFTDIVHSTAIATWSSVTARVRAIAQEICYRDLNMDRRIQFVHEYLLSKIWY